LVNSNQHHRGTEQTEHVHSWTHDHHLQEGPHFTSEVVSAEITEPPQECHAAGAGLPGHQMSAAISRICSLKIPAGLASCSSRRGSASNASRFPNKWGVELENFDPLRSVEAMPRRNEQRIFDGMIALALLLPKMCWRSSRTLGSGSASGRRVHFMPM
jgi:hypothetical protein